LKHRPVAQRAREENNRADNHLHLPTAHAQSVGFHPWLTIESARAGRVFTSASTVGDCFDNAMCESFFATRSRKLALTIKEGHS
jgi:hypothetical protein